MSARLRSRPYANDSDLLRMLDLLTAGWAAGPPHPCDHVGDLLWSFRNVLDPTRNIRLWEDAAGQPVGFAKVDPPEGDVLVQASPAAADRGLADERFDWATDRLRHAARDEGRSARVWSQAADDDAGKMAFLEARGFVRDPRSFVDLFRPLDGEIAVPELPAGFALRSLAGAAEVPAYVAMHRDAWSTWGPSSYTVEAHHRLMRLPGYEFALTPVAVAPNGTLAASCICWLDPLNRIGEIEPLGTRPAYRHRGLARAIVLDALRRMQARGMATARILSANANLPARRLYESLGFHPAREILNYYLDP
jgi:mycothiol synthase